MVHSRDEIVSVIDLLISALVNITDESGEYLLKLPDGRVIDTKGWDGWEWTHGIGLYGLLQYYQITSKDDILKIMRNWFSRQLAKGTTKNINTMSPFLTAAHLQSQALGDYTSELNDWSEWVMTELPRTEEGGLQHITYSHENHQQLWDDTLMMTVLPLTKIGLLFGRTNYLEEAKRQFLLHIKFLADRKTGLWFHGWTFDGRHNFAQARWARGNCWVTIAIPDFLELLALSQSDGTYMFLVATLRVQVDALLGAQDPETGLWHTILDDPTTYLEASATAGFAYGILKSLRLGLIETSKIGACKNAALSAIRAILANITKKGELERTSFGTPVFDEIEEYNRVPVTTMPYGQSLALLALIEYLKTF